MLDFVIFTPIFTNNSTSSTFFGTQITFSGFAFEVHFIHQM